MTKSDVLHVEGQPGATIIGDLTHTPSGMPSSYGKLGYRIPILPIVFGFAGVGMAGAWPTACPEPPAEARLGPRDLWPRTRIGGVSRKELGSAARLRFAAPSRAAQRPSP